MILFDRYLKEKIVNQTMYMNLQLYQRFMDDGNYALDVMKEDRDKKNLEVKTATKPKKLS